MVKKAGCVPVRRNSVGEWEVLLVRSRWTPEVWLFPKGTVESGESPKDAAVRETREEAGVVGITGPKLGTWRTTKGDNQKLRMWLIFVTEEYGLTDMRWKERKKRLRMWHTFPSAHRQVTMIPPEVIRPELADVLETVRRLLTHVSGNGTRWKADLSAVSKRAGINALEASGSSNDSD